MADGTLDLTELPLDDLRKLRDDTADYIDRLASGPARNSELEEPEDIGELQELLGRVTRELRSRGA